MTGSDQSFSCQSRSNRLIYRDPIQSELWQRRGTLSPHSPGLQKVGENKTVGRQHVWGQYPVDFQINYIIKAFKEEKKTAKMMKGMPTSWLLLPLMYRKSGSETANAASVKKALATSQLIFKSKSSILLAQGWFLWEVDDPDNAWASFGDFKWQRRRKNDPPAFLFAKYRHGGRFLVSERWNQSDRPFAVPGRHHDNLDGVVRAISKNESAADFWRQMDRRKKYVRNGSDKA
jgi:hypothetical protein